MSNLISIDEMRKQFAEKLTKQEWEAYAEQQHKLIEQSQKQILILTEKNKQLETLLMSRYNSDLIVELTPEENICIQQISRLETLSVERQLTLEEVKRLDLLVKNLKLIRDESTIVISNKKSDNLKEAELVAIVRGSSENKSEGS
jgi:hypothetical protein